MSSKLSSGTKNAPGYDQAARTVACIAETLKRADIWPQHVERLAFFVAAPQEQIDSGVFGDIVTKDSIRQRVQNRVDAYGGDSGRVVRPLVRPDAGRDRRWRAVLGRTS